MQVRADSSFGQCGCGRSPNGACVGWHSLTEEEYQERLAKYQEHSKPPKTDTIEEYKQWAQAEWFSDPDSSEPKESQTTTELKGNEV